MARRRETKPEQQLRRALDQMGVRYLAQYPIAGYVLDFYLPDHSITLEADGQYWHTLPDVVARDARRDDALRSLGVATVRVSDVDLVKNPDTIALLRERLKL